MQLFIENDLVYVFNGQMVHVDDPDELEKLPGGHGWHVNEPFIWLYIPEGHLVHISSDDEPPTL